uniref:HLH domain-containing protein n=1 Tax=Euplokamis dunlapae TaxID=1403701 RepID=V9PP35_9METZ|nr:HLH domain-containing protein [Euplokamis dunlapae]AHA51340.1 HLH domain-containing protein [Euplokamis dunlapae]
MSNELCHIEFDPLETFAMFKTEEQRFGRCHSPKTVKRINSNARKRLRQHIVNEAFIQLRDLVPTKPSEKKLSKLQILKSATRYIDFLTTVLQEDKSYETGSAQVTSTTDCPPTNYIMIQGEYPQYTKKDCCYSDDDFY